MRILVAGIFMSGLVLSFSPQVLAHQGVSQDKTVRHMAGPAAVEFEALGDGDQLLPLDSIGPAGLDQELVQIAKKKDKKAKKVRKNDDDDDMDKKKRKKDKKKKKRKAKRDDDDDDDDVKKEKKKKAKRGEDDGEEDKDKEKKKKAKKDKKGMEEKDKDKNEDDADKRTDDGDDKEARTRGLDRADEAAGERGQQGRENARERQGR